MNRNLKDFFLNAKGKEQSGKKSSLCKKMKK